jgi:hypothetical protein
MKCWFDENPGAASSAYFAEQNAWDQNHRYNRMHHSMVEIDDKSLSFSEQRSKAAEIAREAGYEAFGVMPHHYRIPDDVEAVLREKYDISSKGGFWKALINHHRDDWFEYVSFDDGNELHWHIVGAAGQKFTDESEFKGGHEVGDDGDVLEHIRDLPTPGDVAAAFSYVMTHATPPEGRHFCTWYGEISYQKFSPEEDLAAVTFDVLEEKLGYDDTDTETEKECHACGSDEINPIWDAPAFLRQVKNVRFHTSLSIAIECTIGENDPPPDRADLFDYLELTEQLEDTHQMNLDGDDATEDLRWN